MHEIVLSIVCIASFVGVLGYILFSKPKSQTEKLSPLFNADVTWEGEDAKVVYERLKKANVKVKFRGIHSRH